MANVKFEFSNMQHPTAGTPADSEVWTAAPGFFKAVLHWELGHTPDWIDCYFHAAQTREFPWVRVRATDENGAIGIWRFDTIEEQFEGGSRQWHATGRCALYGVVDNYLRSPRIKAEEDPDNDDDSGYTDWPIIPPAGLLTHEDLVAADKNAKSTVDCKRMQDETGCGSSDDPCTLADALSTTIIPGGSQFLKSLPCVFKDNSDRDTFLDNNFAESRFNQETDKLGPNYTAKGVRRGWVFKDIMRHASGSVGSESRPILAVYNRSLGGLGSISGEGSIINSNFQQSQVAGAGANALAYDVAISWPWLESTTGDSGYDYRTVWTGKDDAYVPSGQAVEIAQRGQFEWDDEQSFGPTEPFTPVTTLELIDSTFQMSFNHHYWVAAKSDGPGVEAFICSGLSIGRRCVAKSRSAQHSDSGTIFHEGFDPIVTTVVPNQTQISVLIPPIPDKWGGGATSTDQCTGEEFDEGHGDIAALPSHTDTRCGPGWDVKENSHFMRVNLGADLGSGFKKITTTQCVPPSGDHPGGNLRIVDYYVAKDSSISQPTIANNTVSCSPTVQEIVDLFEGHFVDPSQLSELMTTTAPPFSGCGDGINNGIIGWAVSVDGRGVYSRARAQGMGVNNAGGQFTALLPGSETTWNPALNQFKVSRELIVNDYGINEGPELLNLATSYLPLPGKEFGGFTTLKIGLAGIPRAGSTAPHPNKIIQAGDRLQICGAAIPNVTTGAWIVDEASYEFPRGITTLLLSQRPAAQTKKMTSGHIRNLGESLAAVGGVYESPWFSTSDASFLADPTREGSDSLYDTFAFEHFMGVPPRTITMVAAKNKIFDWYDEDLVIAAQPLYVPKQFIDLSQVQGVGYNVVEWGKNKIVFHFLRYLFYDDLDGAWIRPQDRFIKVWLLP